VKGPLYNGAGLFLMKITFVHLIAFFLSISGCKKVHNNLNKQVERVEKIYNQTYDQNKIREARNVGWELALKMMLDNNLELQRAEDSLERAKESKAQIYWDLVPTLRFSANLSRALSEVGEVDSEDIRFSVFSTINFPGLINLYSRKYTALLGEIKAGWDLELKTRQLTIRLRELFLEYKAFETRKLNVEKTQLWNAKENKKPADLLVSTPEEILVEQQAFNIRISENRLSQSISKILGNFDFSWELNASEIPSLDYVNNPLDLNDTKRLGVLLRQKQAADLEALRLTEFSTKLRYFPDLNLGVSSPPLYRVGNGYESTFSADDLIVRASSGFSLDTSLRVTRQLKNVRRQIEFQNRFMREEIREQIQRAFLAQQEIILVDRELNLAQLRLETLDSQPRSAELDQVRIFLEKRFVLIERISNLQLRKARLEGGFWLLDESAWKNLDTR
jgi:hypothetical protein